MSWSYAVLADVSICYPPVWDRLFTRYSPVRRWNVQCASTPNIPARLACVKHAASVRPEPGSNSYVQSSTSALPLRFRLAKAFRFLSARSLSTLSESDCSCRKHLPSFDGKYSLSLPSLYRFQGSLATLPRFAPPGTSAPLGTRSFQAAVAIISNLNPCVKYLFRFSFCKLHIHRRQCIASAEGVCPCAGRFPYCAC